MIIAKLIINDSSILETQKLFPYKWLFYVDIFIHNIITFLI